MADCGCEAPSAETTRQRRTLWLALVLNAIMFVAEVWVGTVYGSTALTADGLDMLSDASVYAVALLAISRSAAFKAGAARISGWTLMLMGAAVLVEVARRAVSGSAPEAPWVIAVACVALIVNIIVLRLLARERQGEVHIRAAWIFTRADVFANLAVIVSALLVLATGIRHFDLVVGAGIGIYVMREALEILQEARAARDA